MPTSSVTDATATASNDDDDDDDWDNSSEDDSGEADDDGRVYKNPRNSPNSDCPRDEEQATLLSQKCLRKCSSDEDCKSKKKKCLCDGACGMSCIKPGKADGGIDEEVDEHSSAASGVELMTDLGPFVCVQQNENALNSPNQNWATSTTRVVCLAVGRRMSAPMAIMWWACRVACAWAMATGLERNLRASKTVNYSSSLFYCYSPTRKLKSYLWNSPPPSPAHSLLPDSSDH